MKSSQYWDKAWSLVDGCTPCSLGCENCWSMSMNKRFGKWPEKVTPRYDRLELPRKWTKSYVWSVWNDLYHLAVSDGFISEALRVIESCPEDTFLVLTKRVERMAQFMKSVPMSLNNLWSGLTVCNQQEADEKIPQLLQVPGHKWLSIEPMLGPIDITMALEEFQAFDPNYNRKPAPINAVVVGCETGPHRRPCKIEWIQSIVDQCKAAGVPCFVKQIEVETMTVTFERGVSNPKLQVVHELEEFPESLRVRELPWRTK